MGVGDILKWSVIIEVLENVGPKVSTAFNTTLSAMEALWGSKYAEWATTIPAQIHIDILPEGLGNILVFDLRAADEVWNAIPWSTLKDAALTILGLNITGIVRTIMQWIEIPYTDNLLFRVGEVVDYGSNFDPVVKLTIYDIYVIKLYWALIRQIIKIMKSVLGSEASQKFTSTLLGMGTLYNARRSSAMLIATTTQQLATQMGDTDLSDVEDGIDTIIENVDKITYKPYG